MLRKIELLECYDDDDLSDAVDYVNNRWDGGRTIIKLTKGNQYFVGRPLQFSSDARVTIDMDGMGVFINEDGSGVIR